MFLLVIIFGAGLAFSKQPIIGGVIIGIALGYFSVIGFYVIREIWSPS